MKRNETNRGFGKYKFLDRYNTECSLQKSSIATEDCIWLGCEDADPKVCVPNKGWVNIELPEDTCINTRMHLTQEQVKELLPILTKFVETGEI